MELWKHTLLKGVIGFLCLLPILITQFGWNSIIKDLIIIMLSIYEICQIWRRECHNFSTFLDEITLPHEPWSLCYLENREVLRQTYLLLQGVFHLQSSCLRCKYLSSHVLESFTSGLRFLPIAHKNSSRRTVQRNNLSFTYASCKYYQ